MSYENPYAPPQTDVGVVENTAAGMLRDSPERVPAGHGWRWLADGFALFKASPLIWWVNLILYGVTMFLLLLLPFVGGLLQVLASPLFSAGLMAGAQRVDQGHDLEVADLFAGFQQRTGALMALGLISLLGSVLVMVAAGMISGVGFATLMTLQDLNGEMDPQQMQELLPVLLLAVAVMMLLFVPLMMLLWFAPALIVLNEEVGVFKAMGLSFVACLKNVLPFLVYGLIGAVLSILATIPVGLGWLVLLPMIVASIYTAYKDIFIE